MTFMSGTTPPISSGWVLVYYVYDPHHKPEWGFDLASYHAGKWYLVWDGSELDYDVLFWAIVDKPHTDPKEYWK